MVKPAAILDWRSRGVLGSRHLPKKAGKKSGSKTAVCQSDLHRFVANLEFYRRVRSKNTLRDLLSEKRGMVNIHIPSTGARTFLKDQEGGDGWRVTSRSLLTIRQPGSVPRLGDR
jgi:hypothetical protein